jgi:hypothetical protein
MFQDGIAFALAGDIRSHRVLRDLVHLRDKEVPRTQVYQGGHQAQASCLEKLPWEMVQPTMPEAVLNCTHQVKRGYGPLSE